MRPKTKRAGIKWLLASGVNTETERLEQENKHLKEVCGRQTEETQLLRRQRKRQRQTIGQQEEKIKKLELKTRRQAKHITVQDAKIVKLKEDNDSLREAIAIDELVFDWI